MKMPKKIVCARCKSVVDFKVYDTVDPEGNERVTQVPVLLPAHAPLCQTCLQILMKTNAPNATFVHAAQYLDMVVRKEMHGLLVLAHDLVMQIGPGDDERCDNAAAWIKRYETLREQDVPPEEEPQRPFLAIAPKSVKEN